MGVGCRIRAHWLGGSVLFFFPSLWLFIYLYNTLLVLSSSSAHRVFIRVTSYCRPPHFKWQRAATRRHCESSQCVHWRSPPSPILSQKDMLWAASWVVCKACLADFVPLKHACDVIWEEERRFPPLCLCRPPVVSLTSLPVLIYTHPPSCLGSLQCHITSRERSHVVPSFEERLLRAENANSPSHWHLESPQDKTGGLVIRGNCLGSLVVLRERRR